MLTMLTMLTSLAHGGAWNADDGVAIGGYDVVAYHAANEATAGSARFSSTWEGTTWRFSSQENLDKFEADPDKYAPAFGGFCAFAVSAKNALVPPNPERFKLYNGELLLFFDAPFEGQRVNTSIFWNADEVAMYKGAAANWKGLSK